MSDEDGSDRLVILLNDNVKMSPKKAAAQAVHAALWAYGHYDHGAVVVLGARPGQIRRQCDIIVHDAGITEIEPGTLTAGVRRNGPDTEVRTRASALPVVGRDLSKLPLVAVLPDTKGDAQ